MDRDFFSCCDDGNRIDFSKMEVPNLFWYIYWDSNFTWTLFWMTFYPAYWILVSQWEYRRGCLRRFFGGSYVACGLFAMTLIPMSIYRDCRFLGTVRRQPQWRLLRLNGILWSGHALIVCGVILVLFSFRVLGLWTSLLGDFFGIHERRQDIRHYFPYTWFHHPMYCGAVFIFLGYSLGAASQAGLFLSLVAMVMYRLAVYFEHEALCRYHHITVEVGVQTHLGDGTTDGDQETREGSIGKAVEDIGGNVDAHGKDTTGTDDKPMVEGAGLKEAKEGKKDR